MLSREHGRRQREAESFHCSALMALQTKEALKSWHRTHAQNVFVKAEGLREEIKDIQEVKASRDLNLNELERLRGLINEYHLVLKHQEL